MIPSRRWTVTGLAVLFVAVLGRPAQAETISVINTASGGGYHFTNFDGPTPNGGGTTINGISNKGTVVGFSTDSATGNLLNFTANPLTSTTATLLTPPLGTAAMANGINSAGTVVGFDGVSNAFSLPNGGSTPTSLLPSANTPAMAFGINDKGMIVGQYTSGANTPGFILNGTTLTTVNAPTGASSDIVNAQGINNNGLVVGFYAGNDGNVHGFMANASSAINGSLTGTAINDPTIPSVPGEPGATFVFSQILGINDHGIAVGYYGDSTLSQHGFLYNTNTGVYTFLDDPNVRFDNGVEVTQITGINNADEITGFYTDASGIAHGFVATVPEPSSVALLGVGVAAVVVYARGRRQTAKSAI